MTRVLCASCDEIPPKYPKMTEETSQIKLADIGPTVKKLTQALISTTDAEGAHLVHLPDGRSIHTKAWNGWDWTHGVGLYGLWNYYSLTGDVFYLKVIESWFQARFDEGGTSKNVNTMAALLTLAYLYEDPATRKAWYRSWLEEWGEWAYGDFPRTEFGGFQHRTYDNTNTQQLWDDTLMMTALPLAKIGRLLDRPHYVAEATKQFLIHIQYLFDAPAGLYFHGWKFDVANSGGQGHHFGRVHWARGNSWVTVALPEFLELLDLSRMDPVFCHLVNTLEAQCRRLCRLQTPSGLWCTVLDVDESEGSYVEASATAGFAFGILKALRMRYLVDSEHYDYSAVATRAIAGLVDNINERGELLNVSCGTGVGNDLQHYKDRVRTTMPYGQAMAIMALGEYQRKFDVSTRK